MFVSVCLSTYFLIKAVFLALGQKNETNLHRKSATEICSGLREIFSISKGLLSVKKHIYLPLLSLEEASSGFSFIYDSSQWDKNWFRWHEYGRLSRLLVSMGRQFLFLSEGFSDLTGLVRKHIPHDLIV